MSRMLMAVAVLLAGLSVVVAVRHSDGQEGSSRVLAHDVYFTLNDPSLAAQKELVEACRTYLSGHEGTVYFAAGARVAENARDVNDQDFQVGLHVYFASKAAHDAYQENARHKEFIAKMQGNWRTVRVFDSWVDTGS